MARAKQQGPKKTIRRPGDHGASNEAASGSSKRPSKGGGDDASALSQEIHFSDSSYESANARKLPSKYHQLAAEGRYRKHYRWAHQYIVFQLGKVAAAEDGIRVDEDAMANETSCLLKRLAKVHKGKLVDYEDLKEKLRIDYNIEQLWLDRPAHTAVRLDRPPLQSIASVIEFVTKRRDEIDEYLPEEGSSWSRSSRETAEDDRLPPKQYQWAVEGVKRRDARAARRLADVAKLQAAAKLKEPPLNQEAIPEEIILAKDRDAKEPPSDKALNMEDKAVTSEKPEKKLPTKVGCKTTLKDPPNVDANATDAKTDYGKKSKAASNLSSKSKRQKTAEDVEFIGVIPRKSCPGGTAKPSPAKASDDDLIALFDFEKAPSRFFSRDAPLPNINYCPGISLPPYMAGHMYASCWHAAGQINLAHHIKSAIYNLKPGAHMLNPVLNAINGQLKRYKFELVKTAEDFDLTEHYYHLPIMVVVVAPIVTGFSVMGRDMFLPNKSNALPFKKDSITRLLHEKHDVKVYWTVFKEPDVDHGLEHKDDHKSDLNHNQDRHWDPRSKKSPYGYYGPGSSNP